MRDALCLVYMLTFPNGKKYIGVTCNWSRRLAQHKRRARNRFPLPLYNAFAKYGPDSVSVEFLAEGLERSDASGLERVMIRMHRSNDPNCGYNLTEGGEGFSGYRFTDEDRARMSEARKGRPSRKRGVPLKPNQIAWMSERFSGEGNPNWGIPRSLETRRKSQMSQSTRRPVLCKETGFEYPSIAEAARSLELGRRNIAMVCAGKLKTTGKLHFEFVSSPTENAKER